jgi:hypothetical protein
MDGLIDDLIRKSDIPNLPLTIRVPHSQARF